LADPRSSPLLLSVLAPGTSHRRGALAASLVLLAGFLAALPFAQIAWAPIPAFVLIQQTLLLANDLITAAVLFGQYFIGRTRILNVLAGGYLFTALIVIPHALTFPGAFSDTGLLGGPQSAAWLYIGWHAVLPLTVIVFALRRVDESPGQEIPGAGAIAILIAVVAAVGIVAAMTLLATSGSASLPALIESGSYTTEARVGVGILLVLPLGALLTLTRRQPRSVLDLWLMVVMFGWLCNTGLGAFASSGRYDVGWYVGRVFDWLTSLFILLIFLSETIGLYARNTRATAVVLRERERRLKCQRRREDASAGRSKNASRAERRRVVRRYVALDRSGSAQTQLSSSINEPAFPSRPASPGHGAQRRGWEERSHAQHREHGEHRTFPAVSTVAGGCQPGFRSGAGVACFV